jgi:hypothetical protein
MIEKRLRDQKLHIWLSKKEKDFLTKYSSKSLLTSSEVIRSLIRQLMKQEGVELKEPKLKFNNKG